MRIRAFRHWSDLRERGDTIVEVLISITVISAVLGGAYVTTNRSFLASRDAQERTAGLKVVESQLEELKGVISTSPNTIFGSGVPGSFCVTGPTSVADSGNSACFVNSAGNPTGAEPRYHLMITRSGNTFTVKNQWTSVRGDTTNQIQMKYRLYQQ